MSKLFSTWSDAKLRLHIDVLTNLSIEYKMSNVVKTKQEHLDEILSDLNNEYKKRDSYGAISVKTQPVKKPLKRTSGETLKPKKKKISKKIQKKC